MYTTTADQVLLKTRDFRLSDMLDGAFLPPPPEPPHQPGDFLLIDPSGLAFPAESHTAAAVGHRMFAGR